MRAAGEAFRRKRDGKWVARYYDDREIRREIVRDTPVAAEAARADVLAGYTDDQTIEAFLRWWLTTECGERVADGDMAQRTLDGYETNVRLHIIPHLGHIRLRTLAVQHVTDWLAALRQKEVRGKPMKGRTRQHIHATLRAALHSAEQKELVARNVAALARAPRAERKLPTPLSNADTKKLLVACATDKDGPLWATLLTMGLRIGEALALSWDDVDLDAGWLWPRYTCNRIRGGHEFKPTKGHEHDPIDSVQPLAVDDGTVAFLRKQRDRVIYLQAMAGPAWKDPQGRRLVFPGELGGVQSRSMAGKRLAALCEREDVPRVTCHGLRHQSASLHLNRGATLLEVQQLLRHKSGQQTSDTYSHLLPGDRKAAERMRDLFG